MFLFQEAKGSVFWERVRDCNEYAFFRDQLLESYKKYCLNPVEALKYSEFKLFDKTGSRKEYEASYFDRRRRLNTCAAMSLIYCETEYIEALEDIIWAICDEYTWALPAHISGREQAEKEVCIDLFASETGFALSEVLYLIGDKLAPEVANRAKTEVERRIIDAFAEKPCWWETIANNWAAVCAAGVAAAYIYLAPQRFEGVKKRLSNAMECFLSSYNDDGACLEGISYWSYGFGFFVYYLRLLEEFSGENPFFSYADKIKNIAKFQDRARLDSGVYISFADANVNKSSYILGLTYFLHTKYNTAIPPLEYAAGLYDDACFRWAAFIRAIAWYDPSVAATEHIEPSTYFPNSEIFISRCADFSFAAKAGHNDEPHNHNDIGSFIFASNGKQILCDLGMGEYTREYFGPNRYGLLVNSSRGHSVPVIDGQYQSAGAEYCGKVVDINDNLFSINIEKAYDIEYLKNLKRTFEIFDNEIIIKDTFLFDKTPNSVRERFVTLIEPSLDKGKVTVGDLSAEYAETQFNCSILTETYSGHSGIPTTAYIIEFDVINPQKEIECKFKLKLART